MGDSSNNRSNNRSIGRIGESAASDYLQKNGYLILRRNFRFGRYGEIDIVAKKSAELCFVEVKARTSDLFGRPSEAVGYKKQRKILAVASHYMAVFNASESKVRFDVIEIYYRKDPSGQIAVTGLNHIENAFTA
ncbi:MAG: YraN family protein [Clostridiales bacterium]|jgi:putative endonuclease|nr:YraN family protein [Clostridiales bacterium]